MFLPKSKYTVKQASYGMFYLSGSLEKSYIGPYIEDYLGRTFAGSDLEGAENRVLLPLSENESTFQPRSIQNELVPSEEDYVTGSYVRYFRQNKVSKVIEEISKDRVGEVGPWKEIYGLWIITGTLDDQLIYGIPYRGVRHWNQATLDNWEEQIPGITSALNLKPEDFVRES